MSSSQLSIQLYTVRRALSEDTPGTLRRVADIGYRQVEPFGFVDKADQYQELFAEVGFSAPSGHAGLVGPDRDQAATFAAAAKLGMTTVIDPSIDRRRWTTREDIAAIAADLNQAAKAAGERGLRVGYHNHAFETATRFDGVTALEVLAEHLDEGVVLEVDTYWAEVGGVSAAELLGRLGDRVQFIHVKDGPITENGNDQLVVGTGSIDVEGILAAAPQALRVVEFDGFHGDIFDAIRDSFTYLTTHGVTP